MRGHEFQQMTRLILRVYRQADADTLSAGLAWFPGAYEVCERLGIKYGYPTESVAVALAHLSPQLKWRDNVIAVEALLGGGDKPAPVLSRSWELAKASLYADHPLDTFGRRADKTRSFAHAILGDTNAVPVDVWMARVAGVDPVEIRSRSGYFVVSNAFRQAARNIEHPPRDLGAVVWCQIRGASS